MSLTRDNSKDDLILPEIAPKKEPLSEEAEVLKKKLEDADLAGSSFAKLLVESENEKSLTEAERKAIAKKRAEIARRKKEKEYMDSLEKARQSLVSASTDIDIVQEGDDKGQVEIDMDLEKLSVDESGKRVEMHEVFTPDIMGFSIKVTQQDEDGEDDVVLEREVKRGVVNGVIAYYYLNEDAEKIALDIPTKGKASISISRDEMMNKSEAELAKLMKEEALIKAQKEAKEDLSQASAADLSVEEKPSDKKRRIGRDMSVDLLSDSSSSGSSSGRSSGGSSSGRSSGRRSSGSSSGRSSGRRSSGRSSRRSSGGRTSQESSHDHYQSVLKISLWQQAPRPQYRGVQHRSE